MMIKRAHLVIGFFGFLDLLLFFRFRTQILSVAQIFSVIGIINELVVLMQIVFVLSLAVSAYGLMRFRRWALILSYAQFPGRFLWLYLSFGFITLLTPALDGRAVYLLLLGCAAGLEIVRLIVTIMIHQEEQNKSFQRTAKRAAAEL